MRLRQVRCRPAVVKRHPQLLRAVSKATLQVGFEVRARPDPWFPASNYAAGRALAFLKIRSPQRYSPRAFYTDRRFLLAFLFGPVCVSPACWPQYLAETLLLNGPLVVAWRGIVVAVMACIRSF
jgi:hypothetical protein